MRKFNYYVGKELLALLGLALCDAIDFECMPSTNFINRAIKQVLISFGHGKDRRSSSSQSFSIRLTPTPRISIAKKARVDAFSKGVTRRSNNLLNVKDFSGVGVGDLCHSSAITFIPKD